MTQLQKVGYDGMVEMTWAEMGCAEVGRVEMGCIGWDGLA